MDKLKLCGHWLKNLVSTFGIIQMRLLTTIFFMIWLRRRGEKLIFGLTGTPGYLEMHYLNFCRQQKRSAKRILILRLILLINVLLAAIVVVPLVIMI